MPKKNASEMYCKYFFSKCCECVHQFLINYHSFTLFLQGKCVIIKTYQVRHFKDMFKQNNKIKLLYLLLVANNLQQNHSNPVLQL